MFKINLANKWKFILRKIGYYNTISYQKSWITKAIIANNNNEEPWSPPKNLGDYNKIRDDLLINEIKGKKVLEIGCLSGRWSRYLIKYSKRAILCDLSKDIIPILENNFGKGNFDFYETKGYELRGIESNSIDFIFSMDTFVRVDKKHLKKYFLEFKRVLRPNGKMLIHLPLYSSEISIKKNYVKLSKNEIKSMLVANNFSNFIIDDQTINHGCLVLTNYGKTK